MHILYISYDSEDQALGQRLKKNLSPFQRDYGFTFWSREDVGPGENWQKEMGNHLRETTLFLALVSPDYLVSPKCTMEQTGAVLRKIPLVYVILRPTDLEWISKGSTILPGNKNPITCWNNRDRAWLDVQKGVLALLTDRPLLPERKG